MITILRISFLGILFVYSCALIASFLYSIDSNGLQGITSFNWQKYFEYFGWPAFVVALLIFIIGSGIGDFIVGLSLPVRRQSLREENKILPAINKIKSIYEQKFNSKINPKIFVMDLPNINGIAWGKNTIAVSSGLLKTANQDEVAGIMAHEIGHLHNKDGFFNTAISVASYPIFVTCLLTGFIFFYTWLVALLILAYFAPIVAILSLAGWLFIGLFFLLEKILQWPIEYKADRFAAEMGFAPALISLFERIEDEDVRGEYGFLQNYLYSHPPTALRIDKLERFIQKNET